MTDITDPAAEDAPREIAGAVKWFDPGRGFGFVVSDEVSDDVLLHANVLRGYGQGSVADGSPIRLMAGRNARGWQAVEVLSIEAPPPEAEGPVHNQDLVEPLDADAPFEPARVKWYDKTKGFGFANVFGSREDVFVHAEVLRRYGLADLATGEAISLRAAKGKRGRLAVEVRPWEFIVAEADAAG